MRLVLDTQVWLDWLHFQDPRCACLASLHAGKAGELIVNLAGRAEWQRVLGYPALKLDQAARQRLMAAFDARCSVQATTAPDPGLPRCRDPDDQKFIDLAVRERAAVLLSRDRALLVLDRRLRRGCGVAVLPPQALESWLADAAGRGPAACASN